LTSTANKAPLLGLFYAVEVQQVEVKAPASNSGSN